jgi:transposase-like protein
VGACEFFERFPDADAARLHIEEKRWGGNVVCPHCGEAKRVQIRKILGYYRCLACRHDFTVRTGTVFERSHVPLHKWLYAIFLLAADGKRVSSLRLSKEIGVTQKTAWLMLQRLRDACGNNHDDDRGDGTGGGFRRYIVVADKAYTGVRLDY